MSTGSMRHAMRELWADAASARAPAGASRDDIPYLQHAMDAGAPSAAAVRLEMHGEIRVGGWKRFRAEEVIHHQRGFVWRARVGTLISGGDALVDGEGWGRWNLLGLVPVARASGADIVRSAVGRWLCESIWLPSMLLPEAGARWQGTTAVLERLGQVVRLEMDLGPGGRLRELRTRRWGTPPGGAFGEHAFGAVIEAERRFGAFTIPSEVRVGWHLGTEAWDHGEFFRGTIDHAEFR